MAATSGWTADPADHFVHFDVDAFDLPTHVKTALRMFSERRDSKVMKRAQVWHLERIASAMMGEQIVLCGGPRP